MRLAFVTNSLTHGGAERHSIALVNRLGERGHQCHAVYVKDQPGQLTRLRGAASTSCLRAARYLDLRSLRAFSDLLAGLRPGVVVAANAYAAMYARLALRRSGVRASLAITYHTTVLADAKEWLQMLYYRPLFWTADCVVFVCKAQQRYWLARKLGGRRNEVIHNGIDPEQWRPHGEREAALTRRLLGFAESDFVVGMCAMLRPEKNHVQMIDAIAALRARGVAARALLIGEGPTRAVIEARARQRGVADEVRITGVEEDVRPLLAACDVVALCSTRVETFSMAALEAMAMARPVVHADLGGAAEMITHGHDGFLFPVGDTRALVERLAQLADPRVRSRIGAAAREGVVARFAEQAMVERYEQLFLELQTARSTRETPTRPAGAH
jgi:glycosyltransferase involved in cell wall biosynthesis